jgi:Uma2 family endonuclease
MSTNVPRALQEISYERWAQEYLRNLPLEHFMESIAQGKQREITMGSLALVRVHRPDLHYFNELLIQYRLRGRRKPGQVVSDNMVVLTEEEIRAETSYNVPLEPAPPFWVMEYVSKNNKRKDYEDSFAKYERDLKVLYYLIFYPDNQELTLYRHNKRKYVSVKPNRHGRYAVPELDIEVALLDGWVRFWYKGELLPLPAELQRQLDDVKHQANADKRRADEEKRRADDLQQRLEAVERELARLRARPEKP